MLYTVSYSSTMCNKKTSQRNVPIPILLDGNRNFGLDNGINTSDLIGDFPSALEE